MVVLIAWLKSKYYNGNNMYVYLFTSVWNAYLNTLKIKTYFFVIDVLTCEYDDLLNICLLLERLKE